jgi:hypothetical protein
VVTHRPPAKSVRETPGDFGAAQRINFHTAHDGLHVHAHLYLTAILTAEQTLAQLLCLAPLAEAYALPALIDGWFTEGFDTADLQEAKWLLEDLA